MKKKRNWLAFLIAVIFMVVNPAATFAASKGSTTTPPAPTLSYSPTTLTNGNVTITVYYPSTAVIKQYKLGSSGTWLNYTAPFVITSNVHVYVQYKDKYGNWSSLGGYNITNIDKTPPVNPQFTLSTTAPTNQDVTVTIGYSSDSTAKQYKIGSSGVWTNYTGPVTLTNNGVVYAKASDSVGNWTPEVNYAITNIDKTAPAAPTFTSSETLETNQDITVTINYSDDSIVKQYKLGISGIWEDYSTPVTLSSNDTLYARAADSVGNWTSEAIYTVANIDKTAPAVPTFVPSEILETNQDVTVSINYSDDSSIKQYKLASLGTWENYTMPVVVSSNDTLYARASDNAGNWTTEASYVVANIDKTAPINPVIIPSTSQLTNQDITVTINFSDDSYIKQYRIGSGGEWADYTVPVVISTNDVIYSRASDAAGNWTPEVNYAVSNIDKTAPMVPVFSPSATEMTNQNVVVTINYSDDSVIKQYRLEGDGAWSDYTSPLVLSSNNTIYAKAADSAGNWTQEAAYSVANINKAPPANPVFTVSKTSPTTQPVTVTIGYSDDSTDRQYRIGDSGLWTSYSGPITVNTNTTVYAKASNSLGTWTPEVSCSIANIFPVKQVLGYTVNSSAYNVMVSNTGTLSEIATATWTVDGSGNLSGSASADQISYGNSNGIKPNLMVGNNFDKTIAKALLESTASRTNLINNILSKLQAYNYKGVNIDIENIPAEDRAYFTSFMSEVYNKLKPLGYEVSVAVAAKTYDSPNATWNYAFDYKSLANYSDYLMIMAYDEHYPGGTPGAIASIGLVTNVINYALTVVPKEKIVLGLAAYGYDWPANGGTTKAYSISGCYNLANTYKASIIMDDATKSKYFQYTDSAGIGHTVWFEDADTVAYKLSLVNQKDLRGIGIWRLGLENTDYWNAINSAFKY